jgi:hypothetical protein
VHRSVGLRPSRIGTGGRGTGGARTPLGVNVGAGAVLVVVAGLIAAVIPAVDGPERLAVLAVAAGLFAAWSVDVVAVAATVLLVWLVDDGFLVDRLGRLAWHGWPDAYRIGVLVLAGALGLALGAGVLLARRARSRQRFDTQFRQVLADANNRQGDNK